MYAKLIIYQQENGVISDRQPIIQTDNRARWELTADNLTPGKVTELLLCLDELGFSDEANAVSGVGYV
ncbi:hypothetical protein GO755_23875 [Spirosoma sp. HMF4905]|uniref:Uncharacterized protein n=1 Tax=Spirosoma arboris TaxID=2682092 RepID=A0A7K1SH26_9BACT|nr:hypothetical protein [Spirosoma arboris]MVM33101.1 hypothetical protein [Spirosoma arboris]